MVVDHLARALADHSDLQIVGGARTVDELLSITGDLALVILDLANLPDRSAPASNIRKLRAAGVANIVVFTVGDRDSLIQQAVRAGVLSVIRKDESDAVLVEAIRRGADGEPTASMFWAAAIDTDPQAPTWTLPEGRIIDLFASGERAADIAEALEIMEPDVNRHVQEIIRKYTDLDFRVPDFTARRLEVLRLYAHGEVAKRIASMLSIKECTVRDHIVAIKKLYDKVGRPANTRAELRQNAIVDGIIDGPL